MNISIGYTLQSMAMRHMSITGCSGQTTTWSSLTDTIEPLSIQSRCINNIHFERSYKTKSVEPCYYIPMCKVPTMICHIPSFKLGYWTQHTVVMFLTTLLMDNFTSTLPPPNLHLCTKILTKSGIFCNLCNETLS